MRLDLKLELWTDVVEAASGFTGGGGGGGGGGGREFLWDKGFQSLDG